MHIVHDKKQYSIKTFHMIHTVITYMFSKSFELKLFSPLEWSGELQDDFKNVVSRAEDSLGFGDIGFGILSNPLENSDVERTGISLIFSSASVSGEEITFSRSVNSNLPSGDSILDGSLGKLFFRW